MPLLQIANFPDAVLTTVARPVAMADFNDELAALASDMFETMYAAGGVGLAAPQVSVSKRLFVMDVNDDNGHSDKRIFINPEIVAVEGEQIGEEGCLSFPGIFQVIKREMRAVVRAQNLNGETVEHDLRGLAARCALHETDHCDGIVFLDRMTPLKRQMAKRKVKMMQASGGWR